MSEKLGAEVTWNKQSNTIEIKKEGTAVILELGSKTATVNQETVILDTASFSNFRTTYVPARFVSQSLGAEVSWNKKENQVRTYFRPYFTDQFINTLIRDEGLKYGPIPASSSSLVEYTGSKTARLIQSIDRGLNEETNSTETVFRNIYLVYTNGSWKVNQVNSFISSSPLNP